MEYIVCERKSQHMKTARHLVINFFIIRHNINIVTYLYMSPIHGSIFKSTFTKQQLLISTISNSTYDRFFFLPFIQTIHFQMKVH